MHRYSDKLRFSEFERRLGIAGNILASRLKGFVAAGHMEARPKSEHKGQNERSRPGPGLRTEAAAP